MSAIDLSRCPSRIRPRRGGDFERRRPRRRHDPTTSAWTPMLRIDIGAAAWLDRAHATACRLSRPDCRVDGRRRRGAGGGFDARRRRRPRPHGFRIPHPPRRSAYRRRRERALGYKRPNPAARRRRSGLGVRDLAILRRSRLSGIRGRKAVPLRRAGWRFADDPGVARAGDRLRGPLTKKGRREAPQGEERGAGANPGRDATPY